MARFCQQYEEAYCQALLNNNCLFWDDENVFKRRKRGFHLPPDDFIYGLKHPKQDGITGVAAALQHNSISVDPSKVSTANAPDFITINKSTLRLGLTKVRDIHQYRRVMNNCSTNTNVSSSCVSVIRDPIPDIVHGRATEEQPAIRDLLENKYLHEWMHQAALRRCQELLL